MTVAPELPGADALADLLAEQGVVAAVGHTDGDAATTRAFLRAHPPGLVTHLFNGMAPMHHRSPGPAMAALAAAAESEAVVELIADGVHLDDETVTTAFTLARGNAVLVTDAMAAAGLGDGDHQLGPQAVRVRDGVARLAHGDSIAGGTSHLLDVVRRAVQAGIAPAVAVRAATSRPAEVLGLAAGELAVGTAADLLILDADWQLVSVMKAGAWVP
jgi:N-acetylglucosamine-6-phosphate deacetylase